ncbi:MAG TPA: RNA 2'-phosphotransferase [Bacteroidia bacterium]|jgi:putative RNA 2'-phosphotransferase
MDKNKVIKLSKLLSYVLRHKPAHLGIVLDEQGWTDTALLLEKIKTEMNGVDLEMLKYVVANNDKKRFSFNDDLTRIRANQGHSLGIDLALQPIAPPGILFHGTATRFISSIMKDGLNKQSRQHVHLSDNYDTAFNVATRHGVPKILKVQALKMHAEGHLFYLSDNKVWLTDHVPVKFIEE